MEILKQLILYHQSYNAVLILTNSPQELASQISGLQKNTNLAIRLNVASVRTNAARKSSSRAGKFA